MDIKEIQELIKFVAKSGATEVDLEIDNVKISIKSPPKKRRGEVSEEAVKIIHQAHPQPVVVPQTETNTQPIAQNIGYRDWLASYDTRFKKHQTKLEKNF